MKGLPDNLGPEGQGHGSPRGPAIDLNHILAPVDFSSASQHGLRVAASVAERFHSKIQLLHVIEPPTLPEWGYAHIPQREAKLRHAAGEKLPQLPAQCAIDSGLIDSSTICTGDAADEICQTAAAQHADVVVLASHGLGGLSHAFVGSTTARVVRHAPCPVLTVRDRVLRKPGSGMMAFDLKRIMVTTDFSEESKKAVPYAVALARKFEASLLLLYVVPSHLPAQLSHIGILLEERHLLQEARERLPGFRQAEIDAHLHVETLVLHGSPAHEICRGAEAQGADLVVMATHGHTGLKRLLLGNVTENVVRHAPCPVLIVREREHDFVKA